MAGGSALPGLLPDWPRGGPPGRQETPLLASADFMQAVFDELPGYNTASIFENVLMNAADAKTVAEKLLWGGYLAETLVAFAPLGRPHL